MTREQRLELTMRRWAAVEYCMASLSPMQRDVIQSQFLSAESLDDTAKRLKVTRSRMRQMKESAMRKLLDMLVESVEV